MAKVWRYSTHDEALVRLLCRQLRVSPLTAHVLIARGFDSHEKAAGFLDPRLVDLHDPELLPGVTEAAARVVAAVAAGRRITIYGDYDVDGVTATALLWHCLKLAGANVDYYIPSRLEEGYGLNEEAVRQLHADDPQRLLVTVDCGISSVHEAAIARQLGLELIITDHHQFADSLPDAACLVHPRLPGSQYPFPHLCGVGVAFKLAWGICQRLGDGKKASPRMREFLKAAVGLTAIGTVADVVPLVGENRILTHYGLRSLVEQASPGLKALLKVAGLDRSRRLEADDIGFAIAPRINAAGRLGQARLAVELLTSDNADRVTALADYLEQLNRNRRAVERRMFKQAKDQVDDHPEWTAQPALVLAHHEWHAGVIGIVANRVAEHFSKPTFMISINSETSLGSGSGRTFARFDLHAALTTCAEHLNSYGGHQAAAGLRIHSDRIESFRVALCQYCSDNHQHADADPELSIDAEVRLADVTHRAVSELSRLGPFGHDNPRPVFAAASVELAEPPRTMGDGNRHLDLRVTQYGTTLRAIAFGRGDWADEMRGAAGRIAISFAPGINRFQGREAVELQLIDWRAETPARLATVPGAQAQ